MDRAYSSILRIHAYLDEEWPTGMHGGELLGGVDLVLDPDRGRLDVVLRVRHLRHRHRGPFLIYRFTSQSEKICPWLTVDLQRVNDDSIEDDHGLVHG